MRRLIAAGIFVAALIAGALSYAQTMQPGTNTPLMGCIEGRALRIVNGYPACATTSAPAVSNCGTGASLSANATDFVGQITTGTSLLGGCKVTFSKLYASPPLGCIAQSNSSASAVAGSPVIGAENGKTTMTISLTLALTAGKITYSCFPV